jgi:signal transduction histidine kinase
MFSQRDVVPRLVEFVGADYATRRADATGEAMPGRDSGREHARFAGSPDDERYARRVRCALGARRIAAVTLVTLLLSAEVMSSPQLLAFFSPLEIALAWLDHAAELSVLAVGLTITYTLFEQATWRQPRVRRLALCCVVLLALSSLATLLLYGYYAHGFAHLPPLLRLLAESLRFGLPAVFLVLVADVHHRALQVDAAAHRAELARAQSGHDETEQQLALLQAQIEPHFLFNVLGNLRRLYRTEPQAGADAIGSLMRYLRAALPQLRSRQATLGDELELVRAYLDLLQVRMGDRLAFFIDAEATHETLEFPPMLLMTLVENAIKHGVEPIGGGSVCIRVHGERDTLHVAVIDDGAGLSGAPSGGGGVGLVNVRRQLAARYGNRAQLTLEGRSPRGTRAAIAIPRKAGAATRNARAPGRRSDSVDEA